MSGRITAISYDKETLPLSPQVTSYAVYEAPTAIVIEGREVEVLKNQFNEFLISVHERHQAELPMLADGAYTMNISVEGRVARPIVVFDFQDNNTGQTHEGVRMDQMKFLTDFSREVSGMSKSEMEAFEMPWSIKYLQKIFEGHVIGTPEFWTKLTGDLDVALLPVNLRMERAQTGQSNKPIVVDISNAVTATQQ